MTRSRQTTASVFAPTTGLLLLLILLIGHWILPAPPNTTPYSTEAYLNIIGVSYENTNSKVFISGCGKSEIKIDDCLNSGLGIGIPLNYIVLTYLRHHDSYAFLNLKKPFTKILNKTNSRLLNLTPFIFLIFLYIFIPALTLSRPSQNLNISNLIVFFLYSTVIIRGSLYIFNRGADSQSLENYIYGLNSIPKAFLDIVKFTFFPFAHLSILGLEPRNLANFIFVFFFFIFTITKKLNFLYLSMLSMYISFYQGLILSTLSLIILLILVIKKILPLKTILIFLSLMIIISLSTLNLGGSMIFSFLFTIISIVLFLIISKRLFKENLYITGDFTYLFFLLSFMYVLTLIIIEYLVRVSVINLPSEFGNFFLLRAFLLESFDRILPTLGFLLLLSTLYWPIGRITHAKF